MINIKPWTLALILGLSPVAIACGGEKEQNVEDSNPSGIQSEDDENEAQPEGQAADQAEDEDQDGDNDDQDGDQAGDQDGDDD